MNGIYLANRFHLNPDNIAILIVSPLSDLISLMLLSLNGSLFFHIGSQLPQSFICVLIYKMAIFNNKKRVTLDSRNHDWLVVSCLLAHVFAAKREKSIFKRDTATYLDRKMKI